MNKKALLSSILIFVLGISLGAYVVYALPGSTFYISSGAYPGSPDFTINVEDSLYYAKNCFGETIIASANCNMVFQTCLDASGVGESIYIKKGSYWQTKFTINEGAKYIYGDGDQTILRRTGDGESIITIKGGAEGASGIVIRDLQFVEDGGNALSIAIKDEQSNHIVLERLSMVGFNIGYYHNSSISNFLLKDSEIGGCNIGIEVENGHDSIIQNTMLAGCNETGIYFKGGYNFQVTDSSIEDSDTGDGEGNGIKYGSSGGGVNTRPLVANCFFNHLKYGILSWNSSLGRFEDNTFFKIIHIGIEDYGSSLICGNEFNMWYADSTAISIRDDYSVINDNIITGSKMGIVVNGSSHDYLVIEGNSIRGATAYAMLLNETKYSTITGNLVMYSIEGIYLDGSSTRNVITGTVTKSNTNAGLKEEGSSDYNIICASNFADKLYTTGSNSKVNLCWNGTSWIS